MPVIAPRFEGDFQKNNLTLQLTGRWAPGVVEKLTNYAIAVDPEPNPNVMVKLYGDTEYSRHTPVEALRLLESAPIAALGVGSGGQVRVRFSAPLSDSPWAETVTTPVEVTEIEVIKINANQRGHLLFWDMYQSVIEAMTERHVGLVNYFDAKILSERCDVRLAGCAAPTDLFGVPGAPEITHYGQMVVLSPDSVDALGGADHVRREAPVYAVEGHSCMLTITLADAVLGRSLFTVRWTSPVW